MSKQVAAAGGGGHEHAPQPQPPAAYGAAAMTDLEGSINWSRCEILNTTKPGPHCVDSLLKQGYRDQEEMLVESDADEQLLITIDFQSKVKVHSISISAPADGRAPKGLKLFVNKTTMDFSDAEGSAAEQEFELSEEQLGQRIELKFVKFQNVDRLTLFVSSNMGDEDVTALSGIKLWGTGLAQTNMAEFKRVSGSAGEGE